MRENITRIKKLGIDELSVRSFDIFFTIGGHAEGMTMPDLIAEVGFSQAVVHRLSISLALTSVPELVKGTKIYPKMGLIEKTDHPTHGRTKVLKLSEAGRAAYNYILEGKKP